MHSSWAPLGLRAAVRCGTERLRTVRSITVIMHGRARTATPSQARRDRIGVLMYRRRISGWEIDRALRAAERALVNQDEPRHLVAYSNVCSATGDFGGGGDWGPRRGPGV